MDTEEMMQIDHLTQDTSSDLFTQVLNSCSEQPDSNNVEHHITLQSIQSFSRLKQSTIIDKSNNHQMDQENVSNKETNTKVTFRSAKKPKIKRVISKKAMQNKAKLQREAQNKKKREQYFTKNFLPAFKKSHLKFLKNMIPNIEKINEGVKQIIQKNGISMGDYVYLYSLEEMKEHWKIYFSENIIYRDFMRESRVNASNKVIFEKYIYRFSQAYETKQFDHIAEF